MNAKSSTQLGRWWWCIIIWDEFVPFIQERMKIHFIKNSFQKFSSRSSTNFLSKFFFPTLSVLLVGNYNIPYSTFEEWIQVWKIENYNLQSVWWNFKFSTFEIKDFFPQMTMMKHWFECIPPDLQWEPTPSTL